MSAIDRHFDHLNELVDRFLARASEVDARMKAVRALLRVDPTRAKRVLLDVAADESEPDDVLAEVGEMLGLLCWAGLVEEFDTRNMAERSGEAFFSWRPDMDSG